MSETKFLKYILAEGIFLILLGLFILISPKITQLSFLSTLYTAFIIYGGFKTISGFYTKNISKFFIFDILTGLIITIAGILLCFASVIDIMPVICLIGLYLIFQSISSSALAVRIRTMVDLWWLNYFSAFLEQFFGIIVMIILSPSALWIAGVLAGIDFLVKGLIYTNISFFEEYKHGVNGI